MNVARPPGGFHIIITPAVQRYIQSEIGENFRLAQFWADVLDRLKITALREGTALPGAPGGRFTFIAEGAPRFGIPMLKIAYACRGDTLTIYAVLVCTDDDDDLGEA